MKRLLALLLAIVVLLAAAGWAVLPTALERALTGQLAAHGFQVESATLRLPAWGRLELPRLVLRLDEAGVEQRIEASGVTLDYRLASLLAGRVEQVSIPHLGLDRRGVPLPDPEGRLLFTPFLLRELLDAIPADAITIDRIDGRWQRAGADLTLNGNAWLKPAVGEGALEAMVALPGLDGPVPVTMRLDRDGEIGVRVSEGALDLVGRFGAAGRTLPGSGRADLQLQALFPLLKVVLPALQLPTDGTGDLRLEWGAPASIRPVPPAGAVAGQFRLTGAAHTGAAGLSAEVDAVGHFRFDGIEAVLELADESRLATTWRVPETDITAHMVPADVSVTWRADSSDARLTSSGTLFAEVRGTRAGLAVEGELRASDLRGGLAAGGWRSNLGVSGRVGAADAAHARVHLDGALHESAGSMRLTAEPGGELSLVTAPAAALPELTLRLLDAARLELKRDGSWTLAPTGLAGEPVGELPGGLAVERLTVEVDAAGKVGGDSHIALRSGLHQLSAPGGWRIPSMSAAAQLVVAGARLAGDLSLDAPALFSGDGRFHHTLDTGAGGADVALESVELDAGGKGILSRLGAPEFPGDLDSGRLAARGEASWSAGGVSPRLIIRAEGLGGSWETLRFDGAELTLPLIYTNGWYTAGDAPLRIGRIDAGAEIDELGMFVELSLPDNHAPRVLLRQVEAKLLGGTARGDRVDLDFARDSHRFPVVLERIELARLLRLERQQGIEGSGVLDGELPVEITAAGLRIHAGQLRARDPGGRIRYHPGETAQRAAASNPNIDLALKALSDYRYHLLVADVDYLPSGQLELRLAMKGKNPDLNAGQPINLNITVEENVPVLLRSLRMADDLSGAIGRRVQDSANGVNQ